jgi:hypothetical protein
MFPVRRDVRCSAWRALRNIHTGYTSLPSCLQTKTPLMDEIGLT